MVPSGWEKYSLQDISIDNITYGIVQTGNHNDGEVPCLRVIDLNKKNIVISELIKTSQEIHESYKRTQLKKNDLILALRGNIGQSLLVSNELEGLNITRGLARITPNINKINPSFLFQLTDSDIFKRLLSSKAGGSALQEISLTELKKIIITTPPLAEQEKIAEILSTWDQAIDSTEKLIANAELQKKALMQQLLTGKKRLLDENGERFSGKWEKVKLGSLLNESKSRNKDSKINRVLSITNHSGFVLPEEQFSKRVASNDISNYKIVQRGEFGYNPSRINVGSFARLDEYDHGVLSPMYVIFTIDYLKLHSDYFLYWMQSHEAHQRILNSAQGSVRETVGFDALCRFAIKLPNLKEQQKIAEVLSTADREIELLTEKLEYLKAEKKALMQQLLTGKRRVKVA